MQVLFEVLLRTEVGLIRSNRFLRANSYIWNIKHSIHFTFFPLQDKTIALLVIHAAILIPSYWIMSHLEDYKRRPSD
uniref:Uncharacterized protein n=1 Tax=Varanus komodoensis TaxID=61221 RepID=A0A8D2IIR9_VARKO